ncbi:MAG: hypothetical protein IT582_05725 [Opitutaceae bacterium]|nr:hypothetical protein [Opitutaceae bacterium]
MNARRVWPGLIAAGLLTGSGGCLAYKAVKTTGELAATTVIVAGKTATTAVKATGRVAGSALSSSGELTATGIESLAALAQAGMVTFVDVATGAIVRVPWEAGMTLYGGGAAAQVAVAGRSIALVRDGELVFQAARKFTGNPVLAAGDVVRLAGRIAR